MLTLAMMCKNESETLESVIKSTPYDQLVIGVDKSSNDNTAKIAKKYADDYFEYEWEDDFSKIRNKTLELAKCRWISWQDGHECWDKKSKKYLKKLNLIPNNIDSVNVKLNIIRDDQVGCYFYSTKILRNEHFKFVNKVHNKPTRINPEFGFITSIADELIINHKRSDEKEAVREEQRKDLNMRVYLEKYKINSKDTRNLFYLGQGCLKAKDYKKGEEVLLKHLELSEWGEETYQVKFYLASLYMQKKRYDEAKKILIDVEKDDWSRAENYVLRGDVCFNLGQFYEAIHWYKFANIMDLPMSAMFIQPEYYGELPIQRLCEVYARMGDFKIAMRYAKTLKKYNKNMSTIAIKQIGNKINAKK